MDQTSFHNASDKILYLKYKVFESNLAKLFDYLKSREIEPILIKGWSAAQYYPKPWSRKLGDVDLSFNTDQAESARKILDDFDILPVDIHNGLRHLDSVDFDDLFKHSQNVDCHGAQIRVLRVEDHLRVLCVHWLNDGGTNKERLWDIFYAIESHRGVFDWERCLGAVSSHRRMWVETVIVVAHIYLGLEIKNLPVNKTLKRNLDWIRQTIETEWMSGIKLIPLESAFGDKKLFTEQIFKRVPPNPLQAVIELEKELDAPLIFRYQILNILTRLAASARRLFQK